MIKNTHKAVINFAYFTANFPYGFIENCWEGHWLLDHLKSKWTGIVGDKTFVSKGDVLEFFMCLDDKQMERLLEWIDNNYLAFERFKQD